jgi:hypothetical protein
VLFMIQSFLFLAFGHFLTLQSIRLQSTLKDIAILRSNRTKRLQRDSVHEVPATLFELFQSSFSYRIL